MMAAAADAVETVLEGTWEEIVQLAPRFNGHRLRVTILPNEEGASDAEQRQAKLAAFRAWVDMLRPKINHWVDDSREAIYADDEESA